MLEQDRAFYRNAFLVQGPNSVREFACARMFPLAMPDFTSLGIDKVQLETYVNRLIGIAADSIEFWLIEEPDLPAATFARRFRQKMTHLSRRTLETLIADAPSRSSPARLLPTGSIYCLSSPLEQRLWLRLLGDLRADLLVLFQSNIPTSFDQEPSVTWRSQSGTSPGIQDSNIR